MRATHTLFLVFLSIFLSKALADADILPVSPENLEVRKSLIRDNLALTEAEAAEFWPLYDAFEKKISAFQNRRNAILGEFGENFEYMTDEKARHTVHDTLKLQSDRLKILAQFFKELEPVLPGIKLARYYQLEYRIRTVVDEKIFESIPLIQ